MAARPGAGVLVLVELMVPEKEAAERLGKSVHAVKFLLHRAYRKLGVPNRTSLSLLLRGDA